MNRNSHIPHTSIADSATFAGLPPPPLLMSGEELYEMIMGSIEPDLLLSNMSQIVLEMEYDTQDVQTERIERYNRAFAEYDRRLAEHKRNWDKSYNAYRRASMESLTGFLKAADTDRMADIEAQLSSPTLYI